MTERGNEGAFNVTWDARDRVYRAYSIERSGDREDRRIIGSSKATRSTGTTPAASTATARPTWRSASSTWRAPPGSATASVALHAADKGMVATRPVAVPPGARGLTVNADAAGGQVLAELCAADGTALEGFSRRQCVPLRGDELDRRVIWNDADLATVSGAVSIRFLLTRSRLYGYRWS